MKKTELKPVHALLLDLGNVLVEWKSDVCLRSFGVPDHKHRDTLTQLVDHPTFHKFERGEISPKDFLKFLEKEFPFKMSHSEMENAWKSGLTGLIQGIEDLLHKAAPHIPIFALTNTNAIHLPYMNGRHPGVFGKFKKVFASHELGMRKPETRFYVAALEKMGLPAHQVLFVDDREDNLQAAQSLGIETRQCKDSGERLREIFEEALPHISFK